MLQVLLGRARGKAECVTGNESREKPCHPGQTSSCVGGREGGSPGRTSSCRGRGPWDRQTREAVNRVGEGWLAYRETREGRKKPRGQRPSVKEPGPGLENYQAAQDTKNQHANQEVHCACSGEKAEGVAGQTARAEETGHARNPLVSSQMPGPGMKGLWGRPVCGALSHTRPTKVMQQSPVSLGQKRRQGNVLKGCQAPRVYMQQTGQTGQTDQVLAANMTTRGQP